jgi:hypothetical protein
MFSMPGIREGRRSEASSERGFSIGTGLAALEESGSLSRMPTHGDGTAMYGAPGSSVGTLGFVAVWKRLASVWEAKVLEMDSL